MQTRNQPSPPSIAADSPKKPRAPTRVVHRIETNRTAVLRCQFPRTTNVKNRAPPPGLFPPGSSFSARTRFAAWAARFRLALVSPCSFHLEPAPPEPPTATAPTPKRVPTRPATTTTFSATQPRRGQLVFVHIEPIRIQPFIEFESMSSKIES